MTSATTPFTVTFDGSNDTIIFSGPDYNPVTNQISVNFDEVTEIDINVQTMNPRQGVAPAVLSRLDLPGEPPWLSSEPQSPPDGSIVWKLIASGAPVGSKTNFSVFVTYDGITRQKDPTIINVDPGMTNGTLLPRAGRKQQAASPAS